MKVEVAMKINVFHGPQPARGINVDYTCLIMKFHFHDLTNLQLTLSFKLLIKRLVTTSLP